MSSLRDPVELAADEDRDLQGIATWEPRTLVDRLLARFLSPVLRAGVVLLGLVIFLGVSLLLLIQVVTNPGSLLFVVLFPLSLVPALALTGYVWYSDVTSEPIFALVTTYLLGIVLASFPFLINTTVGALRSPLMGISPVLDFVLNVANFYLVVAPVEELAKLGAVFMFVYWRDDFDTVIDGAVYGAIAGLGFATIENINFIIGTLSQTTTLPELLVSGGLITTVRSIAGPGHVIWTAIAGYHLGLAKFNREYALPLVTKGLLIAVILHGTYNTVSTSIGGVFGAFGPVGQLFSLPISFGFIVLYHSVFFGYLLLKIRRYRSTYDEVGVDDHGPGADGLRPEPTEFERSVRGDAPSTDTASTTDAGTAPERQTDDTDDTVTQIEDPPDFDSWTRPGEAGDSTSDRE